LKVLKRELKVKGWNVECCEELKVEGWNVEGSKQPANLPPFLSHNLIQAGNIS
jgi:hypothetical protein